MSIGLLRRLSDGLLWLGVLILLVQPLHAALDINGLGNLHAWQAAAWRSGQCMVPDGMTDAAHWHGKAYCPFPPLPSALLFPLVCLFGLQVRVIAVALALLLAGVVAIRRILERTDCPPERRVWLTAGLVCGTAYLYCVRESGGVWFFAHVCALATLLWATAETLGKGRPWLVGLLTGLSFLSRPMTLLALVCFVPVLWAARPTARARWATILAIGAGLAPCIGAWLLYNGARFGSPWESGYGLIHLDGFLAERVARHGMFSLAYVPFNTAYLLLQGPHLDFQGKALLTPAGADRLGVALPLASPFLLAALLARPRVPRERIHIGAAWVGVGAIVAATLLYYNNGYVQTGVQRFTLDFLPLLLIPLARGVDRLPETLWRGFVLWSVWLGVLFWVALPYWS